VQYSQSEMLEDSFLQQCASWNSYRSNP